MNRRRWLWNASLYDSETTSTSKQHYYQPTIVHPSPYCSLARAANSTSITHHPPLVTHWLRARTVRIVFSVSRFCLIQRVQPFFFSFLFYFFVAFFSRFRLKMSKIIINLFVINERQLINHFLFFFPASLRCVCWLDCSVRSVVSPVSPSKIKMEFIRIYFIACELWVWRQRDWCGVGRAADHPPTL